MGGLSAVNGEAAYPYTWFLDTRDGGYCLAILLAFLLPLLRVILDKTVFVVWAHSLCLDSMSSPNECAHVQVWNLQNE